MANIVDSINEKVPDPKKGNYVKTPEKTTIPREQILRFGYFTDGAYLFNLAYVGGRTANGDGQCYYTNIVGDIKNTVSSLVYIPDFLLK